jgi:hypothetical protein
MATRQVEMVEEMMEVSERGWVTSLGWSREARKASPIVRILPCVWEGGGFFWYKVG